MSLFGDNRAQSVQVGAVLLFAILIIFLSIWQVQVVPSENNQVEFQHNIDVQGDLEDYRNSLLTVPPRSDAQFSSELRPTRIRLGTQYPTRIIGVNPPPATGSLSTDRGSVNITAEVSDDISLEGSAEEILLADRNTTLLTYQPRYSEYTEAPTTRLEHTLLYNQFDERSLSVSNQRLIRSSDTGDNLINLVLLEGDVSEQGMRTTLEPVVIDGPTIDVPIEPDSDGELTLSLPTHSPAIWNETIGTDFGDNNARVAAYDGENITIEFDDDISGDWNLRVSKVGLDGGDNSENELSSIREIQDEDPNSVTTGGRLVANSSVVTPTNGDLANASLRIVNSVGSDIGIRDVTIESPTASDLSNENRDVELRPSNGGVSTLIRTSPTDRTFENGALFYVTEGPELIGESDYFELSLQDFVAEGDLTNMSDEQIRVGVNYERSGDINEDSFIITPEQLVASASVPTTVGTDEDITLDGSSSQGFDDIQWSSDDVSINNAETETATILSEETSEGDEISVELRVERDNWIDTVSRTITVEDSEAGPPAEENNIRYNGGLTTTESNSALQFAIENIGNEFARIEAVQVESRIDGADQLYNGQQGRIIEIAGGDAEGFRETDGGGNPQSRAIDADGESIDLDQNGVLSTSGSGQDATVFIGQFGTATGNDFNEDNFTGLTRVSENNNWNIRITLEFQDRGDVTYYFEEI